MEGASAKYPIDGTFRGRVTNITEYGAFVELEPGIEGLVHVAEMSWTKKNVHPGKIVSTSQEVDVKVLEVDEEKRRISARPQAGPGQSVACLRRRASGRHRGPGEVKNATEFGLFVGLDGDVDGMVHMSDIAWGVTGEEALAPTTRARASRRSCSTSMSRRSISLGMKQLERGGVSKASAAGGGASTAARPSTPCSRSRMAA